MEPEVRKQVLMILKAKKEGNLPPHLEPMYEKIMKSGLAEKALAPPEQSAPTDAELLGASLKKFPVDDSGYLKSHRYGGTIKPPGEETRPASPSDLAMHYAEQNALEMAGEPIGGASGGARVVRAADTETRRFGPNEKAQRAMLGAGLKRTRGAPLTWRADLGDISEEDLLQMLGGQ